MYSKDRYTKMVYFIEMIVLPADRPLMTEACPPPHLETSPAPPAGAPMGGHHHILPVYTDI